MCSVIFLFLFFTVVLPSVYRREQIDKLPSSVHNLGVYTALDVYHWLVHGKGNCNMPAQPQEKGVSGVFLQTD